MSKLVWGGGGGWGGGEGDNAVHNYPRTSKISDLLCVVAPSSTVPHRNSPACCVYLWGSLSHALLAFVSPSPTCLGFFTPSPPRSGNGWITNIAYLQKALTYIAIVDCYRLGAVPKLYPYSAELPFDSACGVRRKSSALSLRSQDGAEEQPQHHNRNSHQGSVVSIFFSIIPI